MQSEISFLYYQSSRTSLCYNIILNNYTTDLYYVISLKHNNISSFQYIQNKSNEMIKLLL